MVSLHTKKILVIFANILIALSNKFNFGLFENEPRLKLLLQEDLIFCSELQKLSGQYQDDSLSEFIELQNIDPNSDSFYIQHPLNVYHLIKKYASDLPILISRVKLKDLGNKIQHHRNMTKIIASITDDDLKKTLNGIILIIYSYNLDLEKFSKGIIPANQHGNGGQDLVSDKHLYADDLYNLATKAMEYGFLDTAVDLLRQTKSAQKYKEDKDFEKHLEKFIKNVHKLHNSYLEKHRSVFTDSHTLKPYKLHKNLDRSSKQPKYIQNGDPLDITKIIPAYQNEKGLYARTQMALKSCGGFRLKNYEMMDGRLHMKGVSDLTLQKCQLVHHGNPYTKLGPFKTEIVHNSPVFVIFHELFTDEDIEYLINWATPRLSTEREIRLQENLHHAKTIHKSVQTWLTDKEFAGGEYEDYTPNNFTVHYHRVVDITKRIEKALFMNVSGQWSSEKLQVTSYGLGGLIEDHVDAYGYIEGM